MYDIRFVFWLSFPFPEDSIFRVKEKTVKFPILYYLRGVIQHLLLYKIILPLCDHAFVQTEYMKTRMVEKGVRSCKMTAVPMAVSIQETPFYGHKHLNGDPKIVYLGTLIKIRRMEFLLRTFKKVLEKVSNAKLFMVGGSEIQADEEELKAEAMELCIENSVTITGFTPSKDCLGTS